ncbi:MAG: hypothetical protein GY716_18550 [bacterium]|nr:hypothetical protein [bacterium]
MRIEHSTVRIILLFAVFVLTAAAAAAQPVCDVAVEGEANGAIGFPGECLPDDQCPDFALERAQEVVCPTSWYFAVGNAAAQCPAGSCSSGAPCRIDPASIPIFSLDDCVSRCTFFPPPSFPVCGGRYTGDYRCICPEDITAVTGACFVTNTLCLETTLDICVQSGFDYAGDGSDCSTAVVPASNGWLLAALATALVGMGYFVFRRIV